MQNKAEKIHWSRESSTTLSQAFSQIQQVFIFSCNFFFYVYIRERSPAWEKSLAELEIVTLEKSSRFFPWACSSHTEKWFFYSSTRQVLKKNAKWLKRSVERSFVSHVFSEKVELSLLKHNPRLDLSTFVSLPVWSTWENKHLPRKR